MSDVTAAAERAWTGRQLLAWLQQHPQWLDRPVELVEMAEDGDAPGARYLTLAESDQASDESWVISLCAWPEKSMEPPAPTPPVDRDGLIDYVRAAVDRPGDERDEEVVDALLTAGYVTTRARVAEREGYRAPKSVREALCAAQSALAERARSGMDVDRVTHWIDHLQALIDQIDNHRPLGPNGKHGDRHTPTCGCEGHTLAWGILLGGDTAEEADHAG